VENSFELSQKLKRVLNALNYLKLPVNVLLELGLYSGDSHIELDKVSVERVDAELKELVVLLLQEHSSLLEGVKDWLDTLKVVLLQGLELVDG